MSARFSVRGLALVLLLLAGLPAARPTRAQTTPTPTPAPYVTTLAGPVFGLDGTGEAASFNDPNDVAFGRDPAGDFVLVVDDESHTVHRLDLATRLVTTLAGVAGRPGSSDGFGPAARFTNPEGLAISADRSFALVTDANGVRRIALATGEVRTIARMSGGRGDVAIAPDTSYALISTVEGLARLDLSDNRVTPFASLAQYATLNTNIAMSPDGSFALVSVAFDHIILRVDTRTGLVSELAGKQGVAGASNGVGGDARFTTPVGLTISADGTFALLTEGARRIRRIALATRNVTTLTEISGYPPLTLDGIDLNPEATFAIVADIQYNQLVRVDLVAAGTQPAGINPIAGNMPMSFADGTGSVARFGLPAGISLSPDETYALVADRLYGVRRFQVADSAIAPGTVETLIPAGPPDTPNDIVISRDGNFAIYTTQFQVRRIDLTTIPPKVTILAGGVSTSQDGVGTVAGFSMAGGIDLSRDGSFVLITDVVSGLLRRMSIADNHVTTIAGGFNFDYNAGFSDVVVVGGYALVSDTDNHVLRKVDLATGAVSIVAGALGQPGTRDGDGLDARFNYPSAIAVSEDERYALVAQFDGLRRVSLSTFAVSTPLSTERSLFADSLPLASPKGVAISRTGAFALIGDSGNYAIRRMGIPLQTAGRVTTRAARAGNVGFADGAGHAARFTTPSGIAVSDSGIALVADTSNHIIRQLLLPNGVVTTLAGRPNDSGIADGTGGDQGVAQFNQPVGVAIDRLATFGLVADSGNHTIRRVDLRSRFVSTPAGLAATPGGEDGTGAQARFNQPLGIALACGTGLLTQADPATDCPFALVADTDNHAIRRLTFGANGVATVTTIAGALGQPGNRDGPGGQARLNRPTSIAVSRGGAFALVADEGNGTIRQIDLAANTVSTLPIQLTPAGPGSAPGGEVDLPLVVVALPCGAKAALLLNGAAHTLNLLSLTDGSIKLLAGMPNTSGSSDGVGSDARFMRPGGLATSCAAGGEAFVVDTGNRTVRAVKLYLHALYLPTIRR